MFNPRRVIFEERALNYELGNSILEEFKDKKLEILYSKNGRITGIPGKTNSEMYFEGKSTLVVGVRKNLNFATCKPSAHYQLPIASGCNGMCEYCYLNTQMGKKPYVKIYVNIDEILQRTQEYIDERKPNITIFEGAATSDPIPVEYYSRSLKNSIEFFGNNELGRFRFVTKFTDIDTILGLRHNGNTTVRFSINTDRIINAYEHNTTAVIERITAAKKLYIDGYKIGFIIAPVFLYEGWEEEYGSLINLIALKFPRGNITFEVISHRFTKRAKENIINIFSKTTLPMDEEARKFKFGQFGYGKYIYPDEKMKLLKNFFKSKLLEKFEENSINYII
ncbi:spore photoproduct lyase [Clostridium akagii]|uniref:spore photoproduct lyase n=1 Tax=Clostridium akagii TaxID=91623 RepID=UPI00047C3B86|nr:spore photoproduct lyase [Clostridium akagii]